LKAFRAYATRAQSFNIAVGRFVIMPDHLHLFVCGPRNFILAEWMKGKARHLECLPRKFKSPSLAAWLLRSSNPNRRKLW
jgi:REP element-mobilizing transposase RayT